MTIKNKSNPIKIYLPKTQFNNSESKLSSSLHYLYGFTKSFKRNLTEIYINEIILDQKQNYSSNKLLGSLTFKDIQPSKNSYDSNLIFEIKVKNDSLIVMNGKKFENREIFIIFYDGLLFNPSQVINQEKERPIHNRSQSYNQKYELIFLQ